MGDDALGSNDKGMGVKYKILPFDPEKAKKGAKVTTISGDDVRIICYDRYDSSTGESYPQPIVALIYSSILQREEIISYTEDGKHNVDKSTSELDLVIVGGKMDRNYLLSKEVKKEE